MTPGLPLLPLFLLTVLAARLPAQADPPRPLSFLGFEAGARLASIDGQLRARGGRGLRCDRARRDPRVLECRGFLVDSTLAQPLALWLSAMDSAAGIMTVSGSVTGVDLDRWRRSLETRYGVVGAQVQGGQWMMQWVRRGRMLRLTWKVEQGVRVASVSLVDGGVLDGWGRARAAEAAAGAPAGSAVSP